MEIRSLNQTPEGNALIQNLNDLNSEVKKISGLSDNLDTLYCLGVGGEAVVSRIRDQKSGKFFALRIRKRDGDYTFDRKVLSEIKVLVKILSLGNQELLKIHRIEYSIGVSFAVIMEYGFGDLESYLNFLAMKGVTLTQE